MDGECQNAKCVCNQSDATGLMGATNEPTDVVPLVGQVGSCAAGPGRPASNASYQDNRNWKYTMDGASRKDSRYG